ncbi:MAG: ABC transporter permease [Geminicoccaceae bacterium]
MANSAVACAPPLGGLRLAASRALVPLASLAALVLCWEAAAILAGNERLLPGPGLVLATAIAETRSGELPYNLGVTLLRVLGSFVLAMSIGTALGILLGRMRRVDALAHPWLVFFLNLPALVTIVLCYIWIGLTEAAAVTAVALNKIPNVVVTIREGSRAIDGGLLEMARVFNAPRWYVLRDVVLPQLHPYLLASARSGLALIWKIVLVVELLGRSNGVGFMIGTYFQLFDVAGILAYALAFIVIVQTIEWGVLLPVERRLSRWRR